MHKGPVGPQSGRTPRSQAESIGTDASSFKEDGVKYDPTLGHVITKEQPKQEYKEAPVKTPTGPAQSGTAPFTISGGGGK